MVALPFRAPANSSGQHQIIQGDAYGNGGNPPLTWNKEDGSWLIFLGKPLAVILRYGETRYTLGAEAVQLGPRWVQVTALLPDEVSGIMGPGQWLEQLRADMGTGGDDEYVTLDESTLIVIASAAAPGATTELLTGLDVESPLEKGGTGGHPSLRLEDSDADAGDYGAISITAKGIISEIVPVAAAADLTAEVARATGRENAADAAIVAERDRATLTEGNLASDLAGVEASVLAQLQQLIPGALTAGETTTEFNPDGSIVETYDSGLEVVTTFGADGSIAEAYGPPISLTRTTSFAADGSITETVQ